MAKKQVKIVNEGETRGRKKGTNNLVRLDVWKRSSDIEKLGGKAQVISDLSDYFNLTIDTIKNTDKQ